MSQQNVENSWETLINKYTPILKKKFDELSFDKIFALFLNPESLNDFANNAPNLPSFGILNIFLIYVVYKRFNKSQLEIFKYFTEKKYIFKEPSDDDLNELKNKLGITNNLTEDDLKVIPFAIEQNKRIKNLLSFLPKSSEELNVYMNSINRRYQLTEIYYLPLETVDQYIYEEYDISNNTNLNIFIPKILQFYELTEFSFGIIKMHFKTNKFNNIISCISNLFYNNKLSAFENKVSSNLIEIAKQTKINYCNNHATDDFFYKISNYDFFCIQLKYDMNNIVNSNCLNSIVKSLNLKTEELQNIIKFIIELCNKKQTNEIDKLESKILDCFISKTYLFAYTEANKKSYVQYPYLLEESFKFIFKEYPFLLKINWAEINWAEISRLEMNYLQNQQNIKDDSLIKFNYYENSFIQTLIENDKKILYNYFVNPNLIKNLLRNRIESDYQDVLIILYSFVLSISFTNEQKKLFDLLSPLSMELLNEFLKDTSKIKDTFNQNFPNNELSENEIQKLINFILPVRKLRLNIKYLNNREAYLLIKEKQSELFNITNYLSKNFGDITDNNNKQLLNNDNDAPKLESDNDKNKEK
mgnify:CR=1 FL=1